MSYLDPTGLAEVWAKIKSYFGHALAIDVQGAAIDVKLNNGESTPSTLNTITIPLADNATGKAGLVTGTERAALNDLPVASSTTPAMDGTAAVGSSYDYARADHVHPSDTSRAAATDLVATDKLAKRNSHIWHATCSTSASTADKVATLDDTNDFSLTAGVVVAVTFQYGNSASNPMLNVSGSGNKQIVIPTSATVNSGSHGTNWNSWGKYETLLFTYDGTAWNHMGSGYLQYLAHQAAATAMPTGGGTFTGAPKYAADPDDSNTLTRKSYVDTAIGNAISGIQGITYEIVQSLPASGSAGVIYLVSNSGTAPNIYDEYIWVSNAFEKIGTTAVDLSGYWAKSELVAMTVAEVDAICV